MSALFDLMTLAKRAKEDGRGLTLSVEQTAQLVEELARLMPPDDIDLDDEEIYTGQGLTMGEILQSPEIGSWADLDIGDSAEFVSNMRRPLRSLLNK